MPTNKSKEIEDLLTSISGISRQDAEKQGICTFCHEPLIPFRNEKSRSEYAISGLCQKCQDSVFGKD